jgi:hypothetical protein
LLADWRYSLWLFLCSSQSLSALRNSIRPTKKRPFNCSKPAKRWSSTQDLSPAQWNFKSVPDRWFSAECMEHTAAAEDFIRGMIVEKVMIAPAVPGRDVAVIDMGILTGVPDRTAKVQAPDPLKPTNRFAWPRGSIDHFVESRSATTPSTAPSERNGMPTNSSFSSARTANATPSKFKKSKPIPTSQILITAAARWAALCSGRLMRRGVPGLSSR